MIDKEHWDREMTTQEIFHLTPAEKGLRTTTSLARKVAYLEKAARSPKVAREMDLSRFRSRNALRNWHDTKLGFWIWSDGEVDRWSEGDASNPEGTNEALMGRWQAALRTIAALQNASVSGLERTIKEQELVITHLENQILSLMDQLDQKRRKT